MLLRTVVVCYLGATLALAGTAVSAYQLLQARHASSEAATPSEPPNSALAPLLGPLPEAQSRRAEPLAPLPELRPPTLPRAAIAAPRLPRLRAPLGLPSRELSHRSVRPVAAATSQYRTHSHLRPVPYRVYYRLYYPYGYYAYYPAYPYR